MRNITIKTGLSAALSLVLIALGLVATTGLIKLSDTFQAVDQLSHNWLPSVDSVHRLNSTLGDLRIAEAAHIMSTEPEEMKAVEKQIDDAIAALKSEIAAYDKLVSSLEERQNLDRLQATATAYIGLHDRMIELSRANKNEDAAKLFKTELNEVFAQLNAGADNAVRINLEGGKAAGAAADTAYSSAKWQMGAVVAGGLFIGFAAMAFTFFRVIRPIGGMTVAMSKLAGGDMNTEIPGVGQMDEIGAMANAVQVFKTSMIETERLRREQAENERRAAEQRKADMNRLADQFQQTVGGIVQIVSSASGQLESAASALQTTAGCTQQLSTNAATASEQTSANVQGVAAASEELASTVGEISRQVQESAKISDAAVSQAAKTNEQVAQLSEAANRIGDVVSLINTIAGQTNLLALNATIEAARAGDAGKGFAVVAQEVKALAAQTAKATNEIASQIANMQSATGEAVSAIQEITTTINKVSEISGAIAAAVEQQEATTKEITRNVAEAAKGTTEVASNITDVSRGAVETGSASSQVLASAKQLSSQSGNLSREVEMFIRSVRAA